MRRQEQPYQEVDGVVQDACHTVTIARAVLAERAARLLCSSHRHVQFLRSLCHPAASKYQQADKHLKYTKQVFEVAVTCNDMRLVLTAFALSYAIDTYVSCV